MHAWFFPLYRSYTRIRTLQGVGKGGSKGAVASLDFGGCTLLFYCVASLDFLVSIDPLKYSYLQHIAGE